MAKPTSAFFRAGPSFVPSPVTATTCLCSSTVLSMIPEKINRWLRYTCSPVEALMFAHRFSSWINFYLQDIFSFLKSNCGNINPSLPEPPPGSPTCLTFDQSVFICWRRSCQDSQLRPNLIDAFLFNLWKKTNVRISLQERARESAAWSVASQTSPSSLRMRRLNSRPSMHRKSSPG